MIIESVKTILGEELSAQVETALKGKGKDGKDLDLVVGNDGSYVPADKYDGRETPGRLRRDCAEIRRGGREGLGGSGDPAKLAEDVAAAKGTIETLKTDHRKELARIQKDTAVRMALTGRVHDPADVLGLLDLEKIQIGEDGGLKTDLGGPAQAHPGGQALSVQARPGTGAAVPEEGTARAAHGGRAPQGLHHGGTREALHGGVRGLPRKANRLPQKLKGDSTTWQTHF